MNIPLRHPSIAKVVPILCLLALWLFQILSVHAQSTSWPTDWSCEPLQDTSGEWWESLRIGTVPGVLYHLQESESLSEGTWTILETSYGTGTEWICPLFPGKAPAVAPPPDQSAPPVIPAATVSGYTNAFLTIENTTTGGVLISWNSLDDDTPKRMVLPSITLDPVWYEFDSSYLLPHGSYFFGLSPRLGTPLDFSGPVPSLGPLDSDMVADFIAALPEITANISNSVASAAASFGQRPEASGDRKFFRVAADWSVDSDGDGRFDWQEIVFDGNNPFAADSDGDGNPDVAQDNSGPAPSLDDGAAMFSAPSVAPATSAPPRATIEAHYIYVTRSTTYWPNDPGRQPRLGIGGVSPEIAQTLVDKTTYAEFSQAVESLLSQYGWPWDTLDVTTNTSSYKRTGPRTNSDPKLNGEYTDNFYVERRAFRLVLDGPAPAGGYHIPLRIVNYVSAEGSGALSEIGYEDLILTVDEGQTVGTSAVPSNPVITVNQSVRSLPLIVETSHLILLPVFPRNFSQGACIQLGDGARLSLINYSPGSNQITTEWQTRRLMGHGALADWETNTPSGSADFCPDSGGIYQIQALIKFSDGTKIPVPYLRMRDAKAIKNGDGLENSSLKAGQPDYVGVCWNQLSLDLRDEAIRWLGRTEYAKAARVPVEPFNPFNPSTKDRDKCSIFLTHLANRVGAETPYFYRKSKKHWLSNITNVIPAAPVARDDWHLEPELNIDLDEPGWMYRGFYLLPAPGMSAASYGNPPNSGHCGILDYDGTWISAGAKNVNKSIHLSDADPHYKPTTFRRR
jgi:hypothetical protein